jgi:gluconolactonase
MDYEIVAEGLNFPEGPLVLDDGSLIVCEVAGGRLMRVARNGKLSVFAETGGSPSGLAIGPDGAIYCCNNGGFDWDSAAKVPTRTRPLPDASRTAGGGMIQRIDAATGRVETLIDSFEGRRLAGPNDLQFTSDGGFWFSDFGGWVDDGLRHGGLYRVEADGRVRRSNFGLCLNGVGVSPDGKTVYGAATYERWLLAFDASPEAGEQAGRLIADFPGRQFLDSLAMEADGTVAVAAFMQNPGIMRVDPATGACDHVPTPDEITTNIAFGGADMRDAYLSFSHGGTIARCRWPAPGLRLPFNL